jgi:hypothetical protein
MHDKLHSSLLASTHHAFSMSGAVMHALHHHPIALAAAVQTCKSFSMSTIAVFDMPCHC